MWDDFAYPSQSRAHGVIEEGLFQSIDAMLGANAARVEAMLKTSDRDLLSNCLYATANWARVMTAAGHAVRTVGGLGQHVETVPATSRDRLSGYWTEDDGLVQHWWLMVEPLGLIFDPTAHQFDARGGVDLARYQVQGHPVSDWRRHWPDCADTFPIVRIPPTNSTWRARLGFPPR